ncbi:MAG TPA: VOC family protein [Candidatus Cybelea sp.]
MSERAHYPPGVPCWVDTLQPDPEAATRFYAALFGWQIVGPGETPGTPSGKYFVAQLRGRDVAGISSLPPRGAPPSAFWNTYVAVDDLDAACGRASSAGGAVVVPPTDAPPAGRLAVISDPSGAAISLWEARDRVGAGCVNEAAAWAMSALLTRDIDTAKRFYRDVFGWNSETFSPGGADVTLFRLPGFVGGEPQQPVPRDVVAVALPMGADVPANVPAHWSVDFWTDDANAAAAKAPQLGGSVVTPPHDAPGFRRCVLADPQGAVFSLSQLVRF